MSRPSPEVILRHDDSKNHNVLEIVTGEGLFVVLYRGAPFNIRTSSHKHNRRRYLRVSFLHQGHADNLRDKLNAQFKTDKFTVKEVWEFEDQRTPEQIMDELIEDAVKAGRI